MHLSRLRIETASRAAATWAADSYRVHQRLLMAWADGAVNRDPHLPRLLYRVDPPERPGEPTTILVQAPLPADWERCFADLPILAEPPQQKQVRWLVRPGQRLRFRLRANPTRCQPQHIPGVRGKRVDLRRDWEQLDWLARQVATDRDGPPAGFDLPEQREWRIRRPEADAPETIWLPEVQVVDQGLVTSRARRPKPGCDQDRGGLTHRAVRFDGVLRVTDPDAFIATVERGIGPAKAFGFGLLSLAPA